MVKMDDLYAIIGIGLCVFAFLIIMLGIGSFYGGDWETVSQGVTKFILLIVGFAFGAYVLVNLMGKR